MKKNLGKILLLILLLSLNLLSQELATYSLKAEKQIATIKEPITITFQAEQKDKTDVMFFFLRAKKNQNYDIELLTSQTKELGAHHTQSIFTFILFPLKAGNIDVAFDFSVRTASEKSVAHSYVEDHDDSKAIEMDVTHIKLKPIHLQIKPLDKEVDLVGDFTLSTKIDKQTIDQFGSVNLRYTLKGSGYKANIIPLKKIKNVTLFSDISEDENILTQYGYQIQKHYLYSLSAKKSFHIPETTLTLYSPSKKQYYKLTLPSFNITVHPIDTKQLLDTDEFPKQEETISLQEIKKWLIYITLFFIGYMSANLMHYLKRRDKKEKKFQDIIKSKNEVELILILLNNYAHKETKKFVSDLEALKYHKGTKRFEEIKKELLATL